MPSTRAVIIAFAALLILFAWLQLILSLEIASTGRQIQVTTGQLEAVERSNRAIVRDLAAAEAQQNMANRAAVLGYSAQAPLYLPLSQPLVVSGTLESRLAPSGPAAGGSTAPFARFLTHSGLPDPRSGGQALTP